MVAKLVWASVILIQSVKHSASADTPVFCEAVVSLRTSRPYYLLYLILYCIHTSSKVKSLTVTGYYLSIIFLIGTIIVL